MIMGYNIWVNHNYSYIMVNMFAPCQRRTISSSEVTSDPLILKLTHDRPIKIHIYYLKDMIFIIQWDFDYPDRNISPYFLKYIIIPHVMFFKRYISTARLLQGRSNQPAKSDGYYNFGTIMCCSLCCWLKDKEHD